MKTIGLIAVVAIGAGLWFSRSSNDKAGKDGGGAQNKTVDTSPKPYALPIPFKGGADAGAVLVKFTDFQWPFCAKVGPTLDQLEEHFGDKLRVEYRLFPLSFHEHGESDAVAALAAHKQGKFYEFVTKLYSDVRNQDDATMQRYAKELGLDLATFNADRKDPELLRYARMEQKAGERVGVRGTPTMFLNGHKLEARDLAAMTTAVDAELAAVDALVKDGKTVAQARTARVLAADNGQVFYDSVVNRQPIAVDLTPKAAPKPKAKPKAEPVDKTVFNAEIFPGDPMEGPADALVTVVECTDFQWPFCAKVGPTLKKIHETWPNDVRIVLHTRPLDFHNRAMPAAIAAIAAHQQGKFWPYHDLLFERKKLEDTDLTAYAQELGLDMARFEADLANPKIKAKVDRANAACVKIGASGTPAFFVNGRKLSGAKPFEEFEVVIKEELAKAKKAVEGGIAKADIYSHMLKQGSKNAGSQLEEVVHHFDLTGSPMLGSPSAIATMVVFSDFQWPFCSRVVDPIHEAVKKSNGQLRVVFKHFPLTSIHPYARPAAKAAIAAQMQGKFWRFHDRLFKNQKRLTDTDLLTWAKVEGLDLERLKADMNSPAADKQLKADMAQAGKAGVRGTPTTFINGRKLKTSPSSADALLDIIHAEILKE